MRVVVASFALVVVAGSVGCQSHPQATDLGLHELWLAPSGNEAGYVLSASEPPAY